MSVFDVIDTTGVQVSWVGAEASASTSGAVRARLQMAKSSTAAAIQQTQQTPSRTCEATSAAGELCHTHRVVLTAATLLSQIGVH